MQPNLRICNLLRRQSGKCNYRIINEICSVEEIHGVLKYFIYVNRFKLYYMV